MGMTAPIPVMTARRAGSLLGGTDSLVGCSTLRGDGTRWDGQSPV
jgi:hypothetical protein